MGSSASRRSPAPARCSSPSFRLERALTHPARPLIAVVGGAKVSTKLALLEHLLERVDRLIVGGGIANTFLAAAGAPVGRSLCEAALIPTAARILERARALGRPMPLPVDVVVARDASPQAEVKTVPVKDVGADEMILDIGPQTAAHYAETVRSAGTVVWNGPLGLFEHPAFAAGTRRVAEAIATSPAFSLAGGGDTVAAIEAFGLDGRFGYVSTGGGAFLEYLEGKPCRRWRLWPNARGSIRASDRDDRVAMAGSTAQAMRSRRGSSAGRAAIAVRSIA